MHTATKLSMMLGAGLLTAAIGAGPAQASPTPPPRNDQDTIGYFANRMDCEWVGRLGDAQNRWDDPDCDQVNFGPYRNMYALKAEKRFATTGHGWPSGPGRPHGPGKPGGH